MLSQFALQCKYVVFTTLGSKLGHWGGHLDAKGNQGRDIGAKQTHQCCFLLHLQKS